MRLTKRNLRIGFNYVVTSVWGHTDSDLEGAIVRIDAQLDDGHLPGRILSINATALTGLYANAQVLIQGTFRIHNPKPSVTCQCLAYGWPHRLGSGSCHGLSSGPFCGSCGRPTIALNHLSKCCRAPTFDDPALDNPTQ